MKLTSKILIVDDEKAALNNLRYIMKKEGYEVSCTQSSLNALKMLETQKFDVVITDLRMEKADGLEVLKKTKELYPETEVIIITAYATIDSAVNIMKEGAFYYITKPFRLDEVRKVVKEALEKVRLKKENKELRDYIENYKNKVEIITKNKVIKQLLERARQISLTDSNVLITGESGTGKELFAKYIHFNSRRSKAPYVAINCGTFTDDLLANELFGHEKGAFTGATGIKPGLLETASGGTLLLDEVAEMRPSIQAKILRAIQEKQFYRVGGNAPISVDVRFIAATNKDIKNALNNGNFRNDLYYRLNVISIHIPQLSQRRDDIPILSHYFLKKHALSMKNEVTDISREAMDILMNYDFPGNVRELENIIESAVVFAKGRFIESADLPDSLRDVKIKTFGENSSKISSLQEQENAYINWVLQKFDGNKTLAAKVLGINRASLWRKLNK